MLDPVLFAYLIDGVPNALWPTVDHVVPRSKGGLDVPSNGRLAHFACNVARGAREEVERIDPEIDWAEIYRGQL